MTVYAPPNVRRPLRKPDQNKVRSETGPANADAAAGPSCVTGIPERPLNTIQPKNTTARKVARAFWFRLVSAYTSPAVTSVRRKGIRNNWARPAREAIPQSHRSVCKAWLPIRCTARTMSAATAGCIPAKTD